MENAAESKAFVSQPAPTIQTVRELHEEHLIRHGAIHDSMRERELAGERKEIREYAGRAVYELLHNALDRAMDRIIIRSVDRKPGAGNSMLLVGNDGNPVTAYPMIEKPRRPEGWRRSDFHALLSLNTSNKSAQVHVGNKGIGFRSVFATSAEVHVWSLASCGRWWGLKLRHPALWPGKKDWYPPEAPSFYCPELDCTSFTLERILSSYEGAPFLPEDLQGLKTLVILPSIPTEENGKSQAVVESIRKLSRLPLAFLSHRVARPADLSLHIRINDFAPERKTLKVLAGWQEAVDSKAVEFDDQLRDLTGLDLEKYGEVRVLLPAEGCDEL
ncbi:MAG: hypothetical protein WCN95_10880, partial [bacterium]